MYFICKSVISIKTRIETLINTMTDVYKRQMNMVRKFNLNKKEEEDKNEK